MNADGRRLSHGLQDLRKEFIEELIFPAVQANAIYEVRSGTEPVCSECELTSSVRTSTSWAPPSPVPSLHGA